jgi:hypothetical protein
MLLCTLLEDRPDYIPQLPRILEGSPPQPARYVVLVSCQTITIQTCLQSRSNVVAPVPAFASLPLMLAQHMRRSTFNYFIAESINQSRKLYDVIQISLAVIVRCDGVQVHQHFIRH